jgi:hypothetical protein
MVTSILIAELSARKPAEGLGRRGKAAPATFGVGGFDGKNNSLVSILLSQAIFALAS